VDRHPGDPPDRSEIQKLLQMEVRLHDRVVGQEEAIEAVSTDPPGPRRAAGCEPAARQLHLPRRPASADRLARALAEFLFDDEHAMVRLDISEYQEKHTVARMIGAPPATSATRSPAACTEAIGGGPTPWCCRRDREGATRNPHVLLQVLDDAGLTDGKGRTVDFRQSVIIMTSNIGSQYHRRAGPAYRQA